MAIIGMLIGSSTTEKCQVRLRQGDFSVKFSVNAVRLQERSTLRRIESEPKSIATILPFEKTSSRMNALQQLKEAFAPVLADYADDTDGVDALLSLIRPAKDERFGDFQANFAMALGKAKGRPPREIAEEIAGKANLDAPCSRVEIAGPGFINLTIDDNWIKDYLQAALVDERLNVARVAKPRNYIVDYSSPNVAKPLHVGHIRSTVIGDALTRILNFMGHQAKSDNHVGDWGTQFGMIIYGYRHFRDDAAFEKEPIAELTRLYRMVKRLIEFHKFNAALPELHKRLAEQKQQLQTLKESKESASDRKAAKAIQKEITALQRRCADSESSLAAGQALVEAVQADGHDAIAEEHPDIATAVLLETAKLHQGDAENRALWDQFLPVCKKDMQAIYDRLNVQFDMTLGESFYQDMLAGVVDDLEAKGFARQSEGATCVFLDDFDTPMIIRKKDGAFLYSTTDLATIDYRRKHFDADACLYVVDHRQHEHFEKLFAVASLWGHDDAELKHVSFGTVMGKDGKPFKTSSGDTVGLSGLLDEAESRALAIAVEMNESLSPQQQQKIARTVGIGSLKYADLSQNRSSDYTFDYEKMLALKGNTATYLQYGYARVQGIWRKVDMEAEAVRSSPVPFEFDQSVERTLAMQLTRFEEALSEVLVDYKPNLLCNYLFDLCQIYFRFFDQCPVKGAETESLMRSRLQLCDLTARTIRQGLHLLNIDVLDQM